jgi:hypothetical protein
MGVIYSLWGKEEISDNTVHGPTKEELIEILMPFKNTFPAASN